MPVREGSLRPRLLMLSLIFSAIVVPLQSEEQKPAQGHYLFAWTRDAALQRNDFLAVIDADPASPTYGKPPASTTRNT